jgi:predicted phosphodiesterase
MREWFACREGAGRRTIGTTMARIAVISDIHGNLIAFDRVLADVSKRGVDMMVCLGDIVGYGPDPKECLDIARQSCRTIVAGNHERAVVRPILAENWNPLARAGVEHARAQLTSADMDAIEQMPTTFTCEDKVFGVHDSPIPSDHGMNYLRTRADAATAFRWVDHSVALIGHTHVPACFATIADPQFTTAASEVEAFQVARRLLGTAQENRGAFVSSAIFDLPKFGRVIVNPGSVGQPRDGDNRASYAILDLEALTVEFRRVAYDIVRARQRCDSAVLPSAAASRLALGA